MTLVKIILEQTVDMSDEELEERIANIENGDLYYLLEDHFQDTELDRIHILKRQGTGFTTVFDSEDE